MNNNYGGTLMAAVSGLMPAHLSGASPTTFYCGNLIWQQLYQKSNMKQPVPTPQVKVVETSASTMSSTQYSQYHILAASGQITSLGAALESASDSEVNGMDNSGNTPLHWAVTEGNEDIVQLLVENGRVELNVQNFNGETPLYIAASRGAEFMCQLLLESGADSGIATIDGSSPLHIAAANGHLEVIALLLKNGAFVNQQDDSGDTPLHYAVRESQLKAVQTLVNSCHACVEVKNEDEETPLDLASCLECTEIVRFLSNYYPQDMMEVGFEDKHEGNSTSVFLPRETSWSF